MYAYCEGKDSPEISTIVHIRAAIHNSFSLQTQAVKSKLGTVSSLTISRLTSLDTCDHSGRGHILNFRILHNFGHTC